MSTCYNGYMVNNNNIDAIVTYFCRWLRRPERCRGARPCPRVRSCRARSPLPRTTTPGNQPLPYLIRFGNNPGFFLDFTGILIFLYRYFININRNLTQGPHTTTGNQPLLQDLAITPVFFSRFFFFVSFFFININRNLTQDSYFKSAINILRSHLVY